MSAEVIVEHIYLAWCDACAWGAGNEDTSEEEAALLVEVHNAANHQNGGQS